MTEYLAFDDALRVVERYGFVIRDAGLLASALARPAASLFDVDAYPTVDRKAAALLESAVRNHALIDGNKRTGWTLMVMFLWVNGFTHTFDSDGAVDLVIGVAEGVVGLDEAERRIALHRQQR